MEIKGKQLCDSEETDKPPFNFQVTKKLDTANKGQSSTYVGGSKIFRTGAVKIIKLTVSPIGRRHPRSSSLPHVDTGPTVSSIFGTHPGSSFL